MKFESYAVTDIGKMRTKNEDNFYINGKFKPDTDLPCMNASDVSEKNENIYAVCDGMGGENIGDTASLICVSMLEKYHNKNMIEYIDTYVERANKALCDFILENDGASAGSTLAMLYTYGDRVSSYNVGDSRVYIYRNGYLRQLSQDHKVPSQLDNDEKKKFARYLGKFKNEVIPEPYKNQDIMVKNNDFFLLCSDGLTDMLTDSDITGIIKRNEGEGVKELTESLVFAAIENGGKGNVTAVVIKCHKDEESVPPPKPETAKKPPALLIILSVIIAIITFIICVQPHIEGKEAQGTYEIINDKTGSAP